MEAMGLDNRKPTSEELTRMCDIARREMEVGAYGLSTGLIYMPCAYAETSELIDLCKVIADFDGAFVKTVCTDGLLGGKPHPGVFGSFPRVLGKYVREEKALTLEDAIRKMTPKPAEVFGFERRGLLKPGYFADIVIFNPDTILDKGTFVDPIQFPAGIAHVFINGQLVLTSRDVGRARAGKVLRKSRVH